jgi:dipeptidyl-peptidase 4
MNIKIDFKAIAWFIIVSCNYALSQGTNLNLEDIFLNNKYKTNPPPKLNFINDGQQYYQTSNNYIYIYNTETAAKTDSINLNIGLRSIDDAILDPVNETVLLSTNTNQIYRHSTTATYFLYYYKTKETILVDSATISNVVINKNNIAFTKNNNIYIFNVKSKKTKQITNDGERNKIINGHSDWVYEEEFTIDKTYFWNNSGTKIAYLKFDESNVKSYDLQIWGDSTYPTIYSYKYPKAGENPSVVSVWTYDLNTGITDSVSISQNSYIPRLGWINDKSIFYYTLNRPQNKLCVYKYSNKVNTLLYSENSDTYIELDDECFHSNSNLYFTSSKSGFRHVYSINFDSKIVTQLTKGNWEVDKINSLETNCLYFTHNNGDEFKKNVSAIIFKNEKTITLNAKLSCNFQYSSNKYFAVTSSGLKTAPVTHLYDHQFKFIRTLGNNNVNIQYLEKIDIVKNKLDLGGYHINYILLKDSAKSEKNNKLLIYQYSGPGYQLALDEWKGQYMFWFKYLLENGYSVAIVDPRGSGGKGVSHQRCTYKQLGVLASEDFSKFATNICKTEKFDSNKVSIFGWSFGGYMAALCASRFSGKFEKAVSVAPVTNWKLYDNIYTERYMLTPKENPNGYDTSSVLKYANMMNSKLLLIHGTADDNVHIQNSYLLTTKLNQLCKSHQFSVFPDKNHGIYGGSTRYQLFKQVSEFLLK